ncbi:hypothetical protein ACK3TF_004633 [Chlorella vulgaris]
MAQGLNPLQLDAKNMYLTQLADVVSPFVIKHMIATLSALEAESGSRVLRRFQAKLKETQGWNAEVIRTHTAAIEAKAPYLERLIAVTFLSYVKVLSSVKLRDGLKAKDIKIHLPTNDAFIHKVFVNVARELYYLVSSHQFTASTLDSYDLTMAVDKAIREMVPFKDILDAYLGDVVNEDNTVSPSLEAQDTPEEFQPEPEQPSWEPPTPVHAPEDTTPEELPDTRTIDIPQVKGDDLFSDADDDDADWAKPPEQPHPQPQPHVPQPQSSTMFPPQAAPAPPAVPSQVAAPAQPPFRPS